MVVQYSRLPEFVVELETVHEFQRELTNIARNKCLKQHGLEKQLLREPVPTGDLRLKQVIIFNLSVPLSFS